MKSPSHILFVDDEPSMREMTGILLKRNGYEVTTARSGSEVIQLIDKGKRFDLVVTDLLMDRGDGLDVLDAVKKSAPDCEVIVITAYGTAESAVEAMKRGAYDYLAKPFNIDEFLIIVRQALERQALIRENTKLRKRVAGKYHFDDVVGHSTQMKEIISLCRRVADTPSTVLLSGESGVGKEVIARAIHSASARRDKPFVAINCGALPEHLMESELFGHAKGAFTGASEEKKGLIRAANGGTVLLDEIGELHMALQVKLLRVLQDRMVRPVGSSQEEDVDVRILAATNRDLTEQVKKAEFRQDLFYRLNVIHIEIPPLRERREDIPPLIDALVEKLSTENGISKVEFSKDALRLLTEYDYPGNVRELANIIERAATLSTTPTMEAGDLPDHVRRKSSSSGGAATIDIPDSGFDLEAYLADVERGIIEQALEKTSGNRTNAAKLIGVSFRSFRYRLKKLGLVDDEGL